MLKQRPKIQGLKMKIEVQEAKPRRTRIMSRPYSVQRIFTGNIMESVFQRNFGRLVVRIVGNTAVVPPGILLQPRDSSGNKKSSLSSCVAYARGKPDPFPNKLLGN